MRKRPDIWLEHYELAIKYYEHHGNLDVPARFTTINGYEFNPNGFALGLWLSNQRRDYKNNALSKKQIYLLKKLKFHFDYNEEVWNKMYALAKKYYKHYNHLEISEKFKTKNGIEYDENGKPLGRWIATQKNQYRFGKLKQNRINMLIKIGIRFERIDWDQKWLEMYELAKKYYEANHHLEVPRSFKTKDGVKYDKDGYSLGVWIERQRDVFKGCTKGTLSQKQIILLKRIKIRFENIDLKTIWLENYKLAKKYYDCYGSLDMTRNFKTKNGIDYDKDGFALRAWIEQQRQNNNNGILSKKHRKLLNLLKMRWEKIDRNKQWLEMYELAKTYYNHYGNILVPTEFKTNDGITYNEDGYQLGRWIIYCRQQYRGRGYSELTDEQISLLDEINMVWFGQNDDKNIREIITQKNISRKKIEIINRTRTLLNQYKNDILPSKEELNEKLLLQLDKKKEY